MPLAHASRIGPLQVLAGKTLFSRVVACCGSSVLRMRAPPRTPPGPASHSGACEQGKDVVRGLTALLRQLQAVYERNQATPAMRLLDDLLQSVLGPWSDAPQHVRQEDALERMERAFEFTGSSGNVDIFQVCSLLLLRI